MRLHAEQAVGRSARGCIHTSTSMPSSAYLGLGWHVWCAFKQAMLSLWGPDWCCCCWVPCCRRYTLNIESGVLGQPPPAGHWKRVAGMLKDRCVLFCERSGAETTGWCCAEPLVREALAVAVLGHKLL